MSTHLTPFEVCERLIGRPEVISQILGDHPKTAYGWRRASKNRDAGDIGGPIKQRLLLSHARANDIPLTAEHLIFGATVEEIGALLSDMSCETAA